MCGCMEALQCIMKLCKAINHSSILIDFFRHKLHPSFIFWKKQPIYRNAITCGLLGRWNISQSLMVYQSFAVSFGLMARGN